MSKNPVSVKRSCPVTNAQQTVYVYRLADPSGSVALFFNGCDFMHACAACSQCEQETISLLQSASPDSPPVCPADQPKL